MLRAAGITVYDAEVPTTPPDGPYVVQWSAPGGYDRGNLAAETTDAATTIQFTCIGWDANEAMWMADTVMDTVLDRTPLIEGRVCWPITTEFIAPPIARDDANRNAAGRPAFYVIQQVTVRSTRA